MEVFIVRLFSSLVNASHVFISSGYADRIHELMVIAKELAAHDRSLQNNTTKTYQSEANYIEFSGVKVLNFV